MFSIYIFAPRKSCQKEIRRQKECVCQRANVFVTVMLKLTERHFTYYIFFCSPQNVLMKVWCMSNTRINLFAMSSYYQNTRKWKTQNIWEIYEKIVNFHIINWKCSSFISFTTTSHPSPHPHNSTTLLTHHHTHTQYYNPHPPPPPAHYTHQPHYYMTKAA